MFKTKERVERLESKIVKLETYCNALEKEQDSIYKALSDGMEAEQAEYDRIMTILRTAIENRRKAFEAFHE